MSYVNNDYNESMIRIFINIIVSIILVFIFFTDIQSQSIDIKPKDIESNTRSELKKFRDASFGISSKEVKVLEKSNFIDALKEASEETLVYNGIVGGLNCDIFYGFVNDRLLWGAYFFDEQHSNENLYLEDYNTIINNLRDKYGKPDDEDYKWSDDLYLDDISKWDFAVSLGHLKLNTHWLFNNGSILAILKGDNYEVTHMVRYGTFEFDIEKEKLKKSSNEF